MYYRKRLNRSDLIELIKVETTINLSLLMPYMNKHKMLNKQIINEYIEIGRTDIPLSAVIAHKERVIDDNEIKRYDIFDCCLS